MPLEAVNYLLGPQNIAEKQILSIYKNRGGAGRIRRRTRRVVGGEAEASLLLVQFSVRMLIDVLAILVTLLRDRGDCVVGIVAHEAERCKVIVVVHVEPLQGRGELGTRNSAHINNLDTLIRQCGKENNPQVRVKM